MAPISASPKLCCMKTWLLVSALSAAGMLGACSLAPDYHTPATTPPASSYKEMGNWQAAQPADALPRGQWWSLFRDGQLDSLETKVTDSNQNIKAAFARLEQARAQMRFVRADYLPTVTASAGATRTRNSSMRRSTVSPSRPTTMTCGSRAICPTSSTYSVAYEIRLRRHVRPHKRAPETSP
jgi:outer membrane protein TolC